MFLVFFCKAVLHFFLAVTHLLCYCGLPQRGVIYVSTPAVFREAVFYINKYITVITISCA